jgi:hypothetical protein
MGIMTGRKVSLRERDRVADEIDENCRWEGHREGAGCQIWQGPTDREGYGIKEFHGRPWPVNELRYFIFKGEKPKGMVLRHRCKNKLCCYFVHMALVSPLY